MKDVASQQLGAVGDATSVIGDGLKKSLQNGTKEASRFVSTLNELLDTEDLLKSIRNVTVSSEGNNSRKKSVVHEPIDWSKYRPSAFRNTPHPCSSSDMEEDLNKVDNVDDDKPSKGDISGNNAQIEDAEVDKNHTRKQARSRKSSVPQLKYRTRANAKAE